MGVSLINLQVHTGDRPEAAVRAAIVATYRRLLAAAGFVPLADGEDERDRTIRDVYLAPAAGTPWVGVCDIHAGWEDPLRALAAALSATTGGAAIGVELEDSDALDLYLYRAGAPVDAYSSSPAYLDHDPAAFAGRPDLWADLLVDGATPDDLRAVWAGRPVHAEELLRPVQALLGGGDGWWGDWRDTWFRARPGVTRLAFRSVAPRARPEPLTGPPRLVADGWRQGFDREPLAITAAVGETLHPYPVRIANAGGAARGVLLRLSGAALDAGLVAPTGAELTIAAPGGMGPIARHTATLAREEGEAGVTLSGALPDVTIPAGRAGDPFPPPPFGDVPQVHVAIIGHGVATGAGALRLDVIPANAPTGAATWTFPVAIARPPRGGVR